MLLSSLLYSMSCSKVFVKSSKGKCINQSRLHMYFHKKQAYSNNKYRNIRTTSRQGWMGSAQVVPDTFHAKSSKGL
ncbi:hypothetical protein GDO86_014982 [Hymenochirus boettgeri]|uniref:Uncharacterized protein n=1 Tax=Hymenochirus boettgeri TaxID=247094 RepID=A0A8T2JR20_9PIPI|nr:hypothetical protein GDO86_014982 [Hymenochirus boettgeri]